MSENHNTGFQYGIRQVRIQSGLTSLNSFRYNIWILLTHIGCGFLFLFLMPVFFFIFLLQKIVDPGPFLFKQQRPGYKGEYFNIYKIRTMKVGSEKATALGTSNSNSNITFLGKTLRKLKIDELPQLWNIVVGDMNIVGPRPIPIALHDKLTEGVVGFNKRYDVKPGLSNLGQVCVYDNDLDEKLFDDWKVRLEGELHYIHNQSITYDIVIIAMTILFVFKKLKT